MAIYYYPYPPAQPPSTNLNYSIGDFYINQTGTPFRAAASGPRLGYTSFSGNPKPSGTGGGSAVIPALVPTSNTTPITISVGQTLTDVAAVSAYGGTSVIPTGGTSLANPGITPVYNTSVSPSLPAGLSFTFVKSVASLSPAGTTFLFNQLELKLGGSISSALPASQPYTVTFTDGSGATAQATFILAPAAGPPVVNAPVTSPVSQTVGYNSSNVLINTTATNSPTSYAVSVPASNGTAVASGLTIRYTPTAGYYGSDTFEYTASNAGGTSSPSLVTITVTSPPILNVTSAVVGVKSFTQGVAIASFNPVTISSAGTTPYTYTVLAPGLPTGLSISSVTGLITGTPTVAAPLATYTVRVSDSTLPTAQTSSTQFSMVVAPNTPVAVVSGSIPVLIQGISFTPFNPVSIQAGTGTAPFSFAISPSTPLPTGLLYSTSGTIYNTATSFNNELRQYTAVITDAASQTTSTQFGLRVNQLPTLTAVVNPTNAVNTLTTGTVFTATPVSASPSALGFGTLRYAISTALPGNLAFNTSTGAITGTALVVTPNTAYSVTISDQAGQKSTGTFNLSVIPVPPTPISIVQNLNAASLIVGATTNLPFNPIGATGGNKPYLYSISPNLPAGLNFVSTSGFVTGIATISTPGSVAVAYSVTVTDSTSPTAQTNTGTFNLTVAYPTAITLSTTPNVSLVQGTAVSTTFPTGLRPVSAVGGYLGLSYSISPSITSLGIAFNTSTGAITGTPSVYSITATTYTVTVRDQASQISTGSFNLVITPPTLIVATDPAYTSQRFIKGIPVSIFLPVSATGGAQPYVSYEIDNANIGGLTFSTSTGQISGTSNQLLSTTTYAVTITDSVGTKGTSTFNVSVVNPPALTAITSATFAVNTLTVGSSANLPFTPIVLLSSGYGVLTYTLNPSTLPAGLAFNNGTISGTPTAPFNTATYTINVFDSYPTPQTTSTQFSLHVKYPDLVTTLLVNSITLVNTVFTSTQQLISFTGGASGGVTYSISPQLPSHPALQFTAPGIIQGTPSTTSTTSSYVLTVTDNITGLASSKSINIGIVNPTPITAVVTTTNVILTVNVATSGVTPVRGFGGFGGLTYVLSGATNGTLGINASTGALTGTPSTLSSATSYSVTIRDKASQVFTGTFNLAVISTPINIVQNLSSVALIVGATTNLPSTPIGATGGTKPYAFAVQPDLPSGLTFVTTSGAITGVATTGTTGVIPYSVTVSDAYQANTGSFNLNVTYPIPITLTTVSNVTLVQGTPVSTTYSSGLFPVSAGSTGYQSVSYSINPNITPLGLAFNTGTGQVTGTPTVYALTPTV